MENNLHEENKNEDLPCKKDYKVLTLYGQNLELNTDFNRFQPNTDEAAYKERLEILESIYESPLSPTLVYVALDKSLNKKVALKIVKKDKLKQSFLLELIKLETVIHFKLCRLNPENVTMMYEYYEFPDSFVMILELSKDPFYFEERLENVNN